MLINSRHKPAILAATAFGLVEVGTVRVAVLRRLPLVLNELGLAVGPLLDEAGLPRTLLDNPENLIDLGKGARLLELAAERTGCPHLGLLCGQGIRPETLGIAGRLAQNASDVGSGLRGLILNLHLNGHAVVPTLTVAADVAELSLRPSVELPENANPAIDLSMAVAVTVLRALCGPGWTPMEVLLVHQAGAGREPYDRLFGVPVRFGRDRNAITFAAAWLGRQVHGANAAKRVLLERELAVTAQRHRLPAATLARRAVVTGIARGKVSVETVAAAMGVHPRALNRRLAKEGTSVLVLMKEVRFQIARDLLANTELPVTDIAATLLYSNIGAFTRAFRLWAAESPSDWRLKHATRQAEARRAGSQRGIQSDGVARGSI